MEGSRKFRIQEIESNSTDRIFETAQGKIDGTERRRKFMEVLQRKLHAM